MTHPIEFTSFTRFVKKIFYRSALATLLSGIPALSLALFLTPAEPLLARGTIQKEGLVITIDAIKREHPDWALFQFDIKNSTTLPRSVKGRILLTRESDENKGEFKEVADCSVYLEVPPGGSIQSKVPCKCAEYSRWQFFLEKVYDFILEEK